MGSTRLHRSGIASDGITGRLRHRTKKSVTLRPRQNVCCDCWRSCQKGTLVAAIEGISNWLATWKGYVVRSELGGTVWRRIWPISVEATNNVEVTAEEKEF